MNRKFDNIMNDVDFTDCMQSMKRAFRNEINEFKRQFHKERKNLDRKFKNFDKKFEDFDREFESLTFSSFKETKKKKLNINVQLHITIEEE